MKLEADALEGLKVKDLQRELKKRGLDTSGLKAALLQRLKEHLQQEEEEVEAVGDEAVEEEKKTEGQAAEEAGEDEAGEEEANEEKVVGEKRGAGALDEERTASPKKAKLTEEAEKSPQPEEEESGKADGDTATTEEEMRKTLRIDNFIRPFTLNAVKALVQEIGDFVDDGFWMDAIKTHCFVTYSTPEIAEKTSAALSGKVWPPENGRALQVSFADHTAMEVSQLGEANLPTRPKSDDDTQVAQRQKVTIDEFFQKTETKPVLYYLPLTDEQIKEKEQRQSQQPQEGLPRKRRHRGGRKRNRRSRFRR